MKIELSEKQVRYLAKKVMRDFRSHDDECDVDLNALRTMFANALETGSRDQLREIVPDGNRFPSVNAAVDEFGTNMWHWTFYREGCEQSPDHLRMVLHTQEGAGSVDIHIHLEPDAAFALLEQEDAIQELCDDKPDDFDFMVDTTIAKKWMDSGIIHGSVTRFTRKSITITF